MYNTTPTNALIDETAELYALAMAELHIIGRVILSTSGEPRRTVFLMDDHCEAVHKAAIFWHEGIAAPLADAHNAAHDLMGITLARKQVNAPANSPHEVAVRQEIKRLRLTMAESEAAIRREMAQVLRNPTRYI
ncbi:hypothetical protein GBF35_25815 [Nonomuraea phyllanthi]|uniref:hypothetical protein n=1 Tax=Nonomuraea phyllanthi TaxID=2219224 RepID=UPI001293B4AD|nr:hypothetical protein [Nonomuraea phyllanthi]QFY09615.1 hypothetical protein GBF35_25815 [Nonomuraea phyllanthi]